MSDPLRELPAPASASKPNTGLPDAAPGPEAHAAPLISGYRPIRIIEASSSSELWLAEQEQPVVRRVALKLLKRSTNAGEVIARFKSDRKLTALDHPAILKVLEAGSTAEQPYFAMEYVEGEVITVYCRDHRLETRDRLKLFLAVCEAIQYAHQKAVIHGDLRPSNILIAEVDGKPQPRIRGFGIAGAAGAEPTVYRSPEAAGSKGRNIDTRADVYSLGVILRELLAGDFPAETRPDTPAGPELLPPPAEEGLRVAQKACRADRSLRYDSIHELIANVRELIRKPEQKVRTAWFSPSAAVWTACAIVLIIGAAFGIRKVRSALESGSKSESRVAQVTVGPMEIKPGRELEIQINGVPADWIGEVTVNSFHRFAIDSNVFHLKVNARNGFEPGKVAQLYFLFTDSKGRQIPVSNGGRFRVSIIPTRVTLDREGRSGGAEEWSSSFEVTAGAKVDWSVKEVPGWIRIDSGQSGTGKGVVSYTVLANQTNEERSAVLAIADGLFKVTQERPPAMQIPFRERFQFSSPPPEFWTLLRRGKRTPEESPQRWAWEQLGGQGVFLSIDHDSPSDGNSLLINKTLAHGRVWLTLLYLPHVNFHFGTEYPLTVWMKAEKTAEVVISVGQNIAPWGTCSAKQVVQVSQAWTKYDVILKVTAPNCEPMNNRLVFAAGRFNGKLWIADLSVGAGR